MNGPMIADCLPIVAAAAVDGGGGVVVAAVAAAVVAERKRLRSDGGRHLVTGTTNHLFCFYTKINTKGRE